VNSDIYVKPKSTKNPIKNIAVSKDWIIGDACKIYTPQEIIEGQYVVSSLVHKVVKQ